MSKKEFDLNEAKPLIQIINDLRFKLLEIRTLLHHGNHIGALRLLRDTNHVMARQDRDPVLTEKIQILVDQTREQYRSQTASRSLPGMEKTLEEWIDQVND